MKMDIRHVVLLFALGLNYTIVAMNHALPSFHLYTPPFSWKAGNASHEGCQEFSNETNYIFENHDGARTLAEEWHLVCDLRPLLAHVATLYYVGVTLGAIFCGVAADKWGRRPLLLICLPAQAALALCIFFAPSLTYLMAFRCVQGFFVQGLQGTTFTYLMELFPSRMRTGLAVTLEIFWAVGLALLAAFDYVSRDWRFLQLTIAAPSLVIILYMCWIPESPRWSSLHRKEISDTEKNKCDDGISIYDSSDTTERSLNIEQPVGTDSQSRSCVNDKSKEKVKGNKNNVFLKLFQLPDVRNNGIIMMFTWFCVCVSYYGVTFYLPSLAGQRHVNFFLGSVLEVISYVSAFWFLLHYGCRRPLCIYLSLSGILCISIGGVSLIPDQLSYWIEPAHTTLTLLSKAMLVSAFCTMFLYTSELFPTVLRAAAIGMCGFWGRVGSLTAPQIINFGQDKNPLASFATMGVLSLLAAVSVLKLPETHGQPLPDTILEAQMLGRNNTPQENSKNDTS